jgi:hypothetical protein
VAFVGLESCMAHISGFERSQLLLLPEALDDYVGAGLNNGLALAGVMVNFQNPILLVIIIHHQSVSASGRRKGGPTWVTCCRANPLVGLFDRVKIGVVSTALTLVGRLGGLICILLICIDALI